MAEANAAMATWFANGVEFRRDPILGDGMPPDVAQYVIPQRLVNLLELAFGRIVVDVLKWMNVPEYCIGEVLMAAPALPADVLRPFGGKQELNADFGLHVQLLPCAPVFRTRHMPPEQRAQIIGNKWYYLQASRIFRFVREQWQEVERHRRRMATWQVHKFLDLEQKLVALNFDLADRVQYYECKLKNFTLPEISQLLARLGKKRTPEAIKKSYQRQCRLITLHDQNF